MTRLIALAFLSCSLLSGCAVVAVGSAVVGVAATAANMAVDTAAGVVRTTGKAVGAAADLVIPSRS